MASSEQIDRSHNALKGIVLVSLLVLTLVFSLLPFAVRRAVLTGRTSARRRFLVVAFGLLSCFGGGVFLSTALLDLLPDSHDKIQAALKNLNIETHRFPLSEFLVAIGFFLVLFIEQIVLYFREQSVGPYHTTTNNGQVAPNLDSIEAECSGEHSPSGDRNVSVCSPNSDSYPPIGEDLATLRDIHFDPSSHSTLRAVILVVALSAHATFEGLAVGLTDETAQILQIFAALSLHKAVLAFSLGLRLVQSRLGHCAVFLCCFTFSGMATVGGLLGLAVSDFVKTDYSQLVGGSLQAVACGTFLYVTAFEILPHELNQPGRRLMKLLMLVLGFAVITVFILLYP